MEIWLNGLFSFDTKTQTPTIHYQIKGILLTQCASINIILLVKHSKLWLKILTTFMVPISLQSYSRVEKKALKTKILQYWDDVK